MKSATTVLTILTIATSLLSCQKDKTSTLSSTVLTPQSALKGQIPPVQTANIAYTMATAPAGTNDVIKWDAGSISVSTISFVGTLQIGNSLQQKTYSADVNGSRTLYSTFPLNSVTVPYDNYSAPAFTVSLSPVNAGAIYITGTAYRPASVGGQVPTKPVAISPDAPYWGSELLPPAAIAPKAAVKTISVQLRIAQPVDLTTTYTPTLALDYGGYTAELLFDPGKLLLRMTPDMIDNAVVNQGVLEISDQTNIQLYDMIIKNLPRTLSVTFNRNVHYEPADRAKPQKANNAPRL